MNLAALTPEQADRAARWWEGLDPKQQQALLDQPAVKARLGATCVLTERQIEANRVLDGPATHCMLFGGSRSSKTFTIVRKIVERGLRFRSRHAIMRFRFNHLKASIIFDTLPRVMELCFPGAAKESKLDRSDWFYTLPNGSEIWFGGLDEKERTEKVLGQEHSSIFLNEASQIPLASRDIAVTRLAQNVGLPLKLFADCNPPSKRHWSHVIFIDKIDPNRHQPLANPENYASLQMNPGHNMANLPAGYIAELEQLDERKRRRFLLGIFSDDDDSALWTAELLDKGRLVDRSPPEMQRIVIAVDPTGCSGPEDLRSDEVGIIVAGIGVDGKGYVLEDLSGRFGPDQWKAIVASAYDRWGADAVVVETNFGGAMVSEVLRTAVAQGGYPLNIKEVTASRGKVVRAEPIAALWSQSRVCLAGRFQELEHQMLAMTLAGYMGDRSPDRLDAMVWALTALFPAMARSARDDAAGPNAPRRHREPRVIHSAGFTAQAGKNFQAIRGHRR